MSERDDHYEGIEEIRTRLREMFLDGLNNGVPEIDAVTGEVISRTVPKASWVSEALKFLNAEDKKREAEEAEAKEKQRACNALDDALDDLPDFPDDEGATTPSQSTIN